MTLDNLEGKWTSSAGDFLAKHFHSQADDWDLKILEGLSFLRLLERPNKSNHVFYFWKTSKAYSITTRDGRSPLSSLSTMDELGYDVEWQVLNSKDFQVPQNRERVFIIGHSRRYRPRFLFPLRRENSPAHLERLGNINPSKRGLNGEVYLTSGLAPTLTRGKGEGAKIAIPVLTPDRLEKRQHGRRFKDNQDPMFTLTSQDRHGVVVAGNLPTSFDQTGRVFDISGLSPTLTTMQGGDKVPKILLREELPFLKIKEATKTGYAKATLGDSVNLAYPDSTKRRGRVGKGISNTLTTSDNMGVVVAALEYRQDKWYEVTGIVLEGKLYRLRIRRLTPRECFRLQGFPDWAYERAESVSSKSQLYKQAGNSVTVTVIEAIAREFRRTEEEEKHEPTT